VRGLNHAFLAAGVPRVVASLWSVQDQATALLMTELYRALAAGRTSPAAALRAAQRALRRDPRYRAPYFWAGFVAYGDWD
jgi:CHAT domain-containing protein